MTDDVLLPPGTRLLHIGPQKTGTTAVQSAFHHHRDVLAAHGVHYTGDVQHSSVAVKSLNGTTPAHRRPDPEQRRWKALVQEMHDAGDQRVVLSSEPLTDLDDAAVRRVVEDVGAERVHVVATLRPVPSILPSQWQQGIQRGGTQDYESWLRDVFADPPRGAGSMVWRRHRHDRLVGRWAEVVGPDRVTVVVVDPDDRTAVTRAFDRLVGLPEGTLVPREEGTNRSLTLGETETLRQMNALFQGEDLGRAMYSGVMRYGAITYLKTRRPAPDEPGISTPEWALERAWQVAQEVVDGLAASGVRVIGDLEVLRREPRAKPAGEPVVTPEIAARAFVGAVLGTQRFVRHEARETTREATRAERVDEPSTTDLVRQLAGRAARPVSRLRTRARARRGRSGASGTSPASPAERRPGRR